MSFIQKAVIQGVRKTKLKVSTNFSVLPLMRAAEGDGGQVEKVNKRVQQLAALLQPGKSITVESLFGCLRDIGLLTGGFDSHIEIKTPLAGFEDASFSFQLKLAQYVLLMCRDLFSQLQTTGLGFYGGLILARVAMFERHYAYQVNALTGQSVMPNFVEVKELLLGDIWRKFSAQADSAGGGRLLVVIRSCIWQLIDLAAAPSIFVRSSETDKKQYGLYLVNYQCVNPGDVVLCVFTAKAKLTQLLDSEIKLTPAHKEQIQSLLERLEQVKPKTMLELPELAALQVACQKAHKTLSRVQAQFRGFWGIGRTLRHILSVDWVKAPVGETQADWYTRLLFVLDNLDRGLAFEKSLANRQGPAIDQLKRLSKSLHKLLVESRPLMPMKKADHLVKELLARVGTSTSVIVLGEEQQQAAADAKVGGGGGAPSQ